MPMSDFSTPLGLIVVGLGTLGFSAFLEKFAAQHASPRAREIHKAAFRFENRRRLSFVMVIVGCLWLMQEAVASILLR